MLMISWVGPRKCGPLLKIAFNLVTSRPWLLRAVNSWLAVWRASTALASSTTASRLRSNSTLGIGPRSVNSAGRSRTSAAPPSPATIHWRTLPHRCSIRLPMLFREAWERHHTCSSVNWPRQCLILARALTNSLPASLPTAPAKSSAVMLLAPCRSLHQLDLARVVHFDVGPVLPADHHPMNPDGFALVVGGRVVDSCLAEFRPSILGDDHTQVSRVTMVRLGVQEDLPGTGATLRPLDEHFHRD